MSRYSDDAESISILIRGDRIDSLRRVVFNGHSFPNLPGDAVGVINYYGDVAVVRRDEQGGLFMDLAEPLMPGRGRSLTRRLILN